MKHFAIRIDHQSQTEGLVTKLLSDYKPKGFEVLQDKSGALFSIAEIAHYLDKEERHGIKILTTALSQSLLSMSSGERKKALLQHLLCQKPDFLILINPFDHLDMESQKDLRNRLSELAKTISIIQFASRVDDILEFTTDFFELREDRLIDYASAEDLATSLPQKEIFVASIPQVIKKEILDMTEFVRFQKVSVCFEGKKVLQNISWSIKKGEFWQLVGPNGSGKSTLLNMITGDSHKGFGQNLWLFGNLKGSGESVWDIKKNIGYFTPSMTDKFRGHHTIENMLISGLHDSIGLYNTPSEAEKRLTLQWINVLNLTEKKHGYFHELSNGQKRLVMLARAMVKHPPLLILDEPTSDLDDTNAHLFVALVNKIAKETDTTILFVSHKPEPSLKPLHTYQLIPSPNGSTGKTVTFKND
ncbi:hypothetical protein MTsPCn5_28330 [Croceitalea sp. MTPC5]|uniref:ATP-binding cassette domain-containing protein n=1 Tax=Croceitalea sp. MTPC5 TaxID=3056565 RepID=UPI002B38FA9A|nr:hypothetical protein MTsPCn5_28330 [Croceitalea sp. MTPC5]